MKNNNNNKQKNDATEIVVSNLKGLDKLGKAKTSIQLTVSYRDVEDWKERVGEEIRCIYIGCKEEEGDNGSYTLALFTEADGTQFCCAQTILIEAVKNLQAGQGVAITCTGVKKRKSGGGTVVMFEVLALDFRVDV